ncbi:MAG: hypothetical protein RI911_789 [Candidatus Parcubacteria bacterium]|jgi:uncharacterized protein (TIGR00645 family)
MEKDLLNTLGHALFKMRFLMSAFYVGLVVVLIVTLFKFIIEVFHVIEKVLFHEIEKIDLIIKVLELVDMTMVAQLIWVVALAGFSLFVTDAYFKGKNEVKPDWLEQVNTYSLKLKLAFAMISISGVHALKTYLSGIDMDKVVLTAAVHLAFVIAAAGIAYSEYITSLTHEKNRHHE